MRLILPVIVATIAAGWSLSAATTLPTFKAERW